MGRNRRYRSDAERQRAYRRRKAEEEAWLRREAGLRFGGKAPTKRQPVPAKLIKILGMLGSDLPAERDKAARVATQMLKDAGLTWYDVLDTGPEKK